MAKDDDEEILLPKKSASKKVSPQMARLIRIVRGIGLVLGGGVTLVGVMGLVGLVTGSFLARLLVALVLVVGLPAVVADRLLKKTKLGGGIAMVADVFAIVLLAVALVLVGVDPVAKRLFVTEGDHYAESGSRTMASVSYWLGGVSPVYPEERGLPAQVGPGAPAQDADAGADAGADAAGGGSK